MVPTTDPVGGGTDVAIAGSGLANITAVRLGSVNAKFCFASDAQIHVTSPPANAASAVDVMLQTRSGSVLVGQFTYR